MLVFDCNDDVTIVVDAPVITDQPDDQIDIIQGMNAIFSVEASGLMLTYQWQKGGVGISDTDDTYSGTTSKTLTVISVTEPDDNGDFRVVVTNPTGSVTSTPATLTVCKLLVQYTETVVCVGLRPFFGSYLTATPPIPVQWPRLSLKQTLRICVLPWTAQSHCLSLPLAVTSHTSGFKE